MQTQRPSSESNDVAVEFGDYRIYELIGAGGMAEVYRATHLPGGQGPGKAVVIKRVKPEHAGDPGFVQMFVDEAKLSARLQHDNIVRVFEYGVQDGHHFIAMEYIDGLHLQGLHVRYTQRHRRSLPWAIGARIVRDVLRGLEHAHTCIDDHGRPLGLVHRDINLVNVMVGRGGQVKVLDFGIVKAADGIRSAETVGAVLKGKFGYMSPEQAEGKRLDPRSDVFAASIVLHELLTGRRLFFGKDDLEILRRVRAADVVDPRKYAPDVPEPLVAVVLRGLKRDREARYGSAGEMAAALDDLVEVAPGADDPLAELMDELLGGPTSKAAARMSKRRRKMTLAAWRQGVREHEPRGRKVVAGTLSDADDTPTAPGKRHQADGDPLDEDTVITTEIKWLSAGPSGEAEPVISEQAQAALDETAEAELAEELAEELADLEDEPASPADVPSLGLLAAKTRILDDSEELSAPDAKTVILEEEADRPSLDAKTVILDDPDETS